MKARLIVAAIGLPLLIAVFLFLPVWVTVLLVALTCALGSFELLRAFGADVTIDGDRVTVCGGNLHAITLDADDIPDLVPPIAAVAAMADGTTRIENCARLRIKESDRLETVRATLCAFGIEAQIDGDALLITGGTPVGAQIDSFDDHRIAMTGAILAARATGDTTLTNPMAVNKSYPAFYDDYQTLGGQVHGICIR